MVLFSLFRFRALLPADGVHCDAYDSDLSRGFFIARKSGEDVFWLGFVFSGEEFESAALL